jgi:molybdopterin-containing oxidoreductase family membrane subunit
VFTLGSVTDKISTMIFSDAPLWWWIGFGIAGSLALVFVIVLITLATQGTGIWGINIPTVWSVDITNLVFWIGIGHAGTFISAFLLLMRQHWRTAFSRFAEAMTLFALATAGMFPLFHVGRPEFIYYFAPYPNTMWLNPQWRSPLVWDAFAITTYALISAVFWFVDMLPDLAALRDKAKRRFVKMLYGFLCLGWRGDSLHWERLNRVSFLLAALATPLVISVHSIVGLDFAIGNLPGWHHTIFPPYFVAGAIFSGLAMMIIVGVGLRAGFRMQNLITLEHLNKAALLMLVTGLLVTYGYAAEAFGAWYKGDIHEVLLVSERTFGPYAPLFWGMILFNCVIIHALWFKRVRTNVNLLVLICLGILVGMWLERFVIVAVSLSYPYLTSAWKVYTPTIWDFLTVISPFGFFLAPFFLFIRYLPVVPVAETQAVAIEENGHHD